MHKNELIKSYSQMAWQALYAGLEFYGIKYGEDYTDVSGNNSVMVLSYSLKMINTSKWRKLSSISTEISQMMQLEGDSRVRVSFIGMDYRIEVPKPRQLHDTVSIDDVFGSSKGLSVAFGVSAYDNKASGVDFSKNTSDLASRDHHDSNDVSCDF